MIEINQQCQLRFTQVPPFPDVVQTSATGVLNDGKYVCVWDKILLTDMDSVLEEPVFTLRVEPAVGRFVSLSNEQ